MLSMKDKGKYAVDDGREEVCYRQRTRESMLSTKDKGKHISKMYERKDVSLMYERKYSADEGRVETCINDRGRVISTNIMNCTIKRKRIEYQQLFLK